MRRTGFLLLALLVGAPASAQIQGIGYRLNPTASYVTFDGDAALSDGLLYGGGVGLSFGEFFELGGSYLYGGSFETDFSGLSGLDDAPELRAALGAVPARGVNVQRYGGDLKVNLTTTAIVPYLTAGTGIVRFGPDDLEATRSIYLIGGAGVQVTLADRYALSVSAEDFTYRLSPGAALLSGDDLAATGLGARDFNQTTVHNLAVRAAARVYIGGRRPGDFTEFDRAFQRQFSGGLGGLSLVVEPFYARANFDEVFAYRDQAFVGAEAGFDFGPLVGLRGFYGRGTDTSDPTDLEGIQMMGGDIRFRLSEGRGLVPFLSVGGGYLDVLDGYATDDGAEDGNATAEDSPFAAGGVGVGFLLSPRFRAIAEVRGLLMSTQDEADVSRPEDVYLSTLLRGGVSFGIGGKTARRVDVVRQSDLDAERALMDAERAELVATRDSVRSELAALDAQRNAERGRALSRRLELTAALDAQLADARATGDSLAVARLEAERAAVQARAAELDRAAPPLDSLVAEEEVEIVEADHMVTIPLPREGELYVRYGPPGGVVIDSGEFPEADLRAAVRAALLDVLAADPLAPALTEADVAAVEQRVVDRLSAQRAPAAPATSVTISDLDRLEQRLETRFLQELRALREALGQEAPVDPKDRAVESDTGN